VDDRGVAAREVEPSEVWRGQQSSALDVIERHNVQDGVLLMRVASRRARSAARSATAERRAWGRFDPRARLCSRTPVA
jgi:hypothetical protein